MNPTHLSLFTGIGGFDMGFEAAGFETLAQVEFDRFCNQVLERHWPEVERDRDVALYTPAHRNPTVVTFGSPCQDLSVAGRREGLVGARSSLFFEATRVIAECRPTFAVWENVPGAFSSNRGHDFRAVLVAMEQLGATDIAWRVFDSQYAGVPQQRRRVYLVADFGGRRAGEILFESEGCEGHPPPSGEEGEGLASTLAAGAYRSGRPGGSHDTDLVSKPLGSNATGGFLFDLDHDTYVTTGDRVAPCFTAGAHPGGFNGQDVTSLMLIQDVRGGAAKAQNGIGVSPDAETAYTLDAVSQPAVVYNEAQLTHRENRQRGRHEGSYPLDGSGRQIIAGAAIRRFTPVECERLQGFPDGWTCLCGAGGDMFACSCADGPRYRALGNAATTTVPGWIARRMRAVL